MATKIVKVGSHVKVVIEGEVNDFYGTGGRKLKEDDCIGINTEHGVIYLEVEKNLAPFVEVIPEPLKPGLYADSNFVQDGSTQMSCLYKLGSNGKWYNNLLEEINQPELDRIIPIYIPEEK